MWRLRTKDIWNALSQVHHRSAGTRFLRSTGNGGSRLQDERPSALQTEAYPSSSPSSSSSSGFSLPSWTDGGISDSTPAAGGVAASFSWAFFRNSGGILGMLRAPGVGSFH